MNWEIPILCILFRLLKARIFSEPIKKARLSNRAQVLSISWAAEHNYYRALNTRVTGQVVCVGNRFCNKKVDKGSCQAESQKRGVGERERGVRKKEGVRARVTGLERKGKGASLVPHSPSFRPATPLCTPPLLSPILSPARHGICHGKHFLVNICFLISCKTI